MIKEKKDAIALLKEDHRNVEALFEKFEKAKDAKTKKALATEICTELSVHAAIEEEIFYPACHEAVEDDLRAEAYVEHDGAKVLIAELAGSGPEEDEGAERGHQAPRHTKGKQHDEDTYTRL